MSVTRTFDILNQLIEQFNKDDILAGKRNGEWVTYSAEDYLQYSTMLSYGFMKLGYKKGDKVVTIFNSRPEWNFVDMALAMIGVVHVPLYPTLNQADYHLLINHSDANGVIISNIALYNSISPILNKCPKVEHVFTVDSIEGEDALIEVVKLGATVEEEYATKLKEIKASILPQDLLTIIYTSGTTGTPKGVMLSHENIVSNAISTSKVQPLNHTHKALSFLPLCHVYERMMNYHQQYLGISIYYADNLGTIVKNMKEISADGFNTVPRVLEKIYDNIQSAGKNLKGIKKIVYRMAFRHGLRFDHNKKNPFWLINQPIFDRLVYKKWREALGGKNLVVVSGGSAIQTRIVRLLSAAGMHIFEGYGLTETAPVIAVSNPKAGFVKIGTVGPILENVQVKFGEDKEIITKGPNLMLGYYKDEAYTKSVMDEEGWFYTGDIGELINNTYLKITDRKKEIFKLSGGKYVAPQVIENKLSESLFIENSCVVGDGEKFASAIISPNFQHLHFWANRHHILYRDNKELIEHKSVHKRFQKEIDKLNKTRSTFEHIKRFRLTDKEWTTESGELSPTLKLKRSIIHKNYKELILDIYGRRATKNDFLPRFNKSQLNWYVNKLTIKDINLKKIKKKPIK